MTSPLNTVPLLVPGPGEDPYDLVVRTCEAHVDRDGWHDTDAPMNLFWLHRPVFGIAVSQPPLPAGIRFAHPIQVLPHLAHTFEVFIANGHTPPDLFGFVLTFEGWTGEPGQGRPSEHPDRGEVREALLGTFDGQRRQAARRRGFPDVEVGHDMIQGPIAEMFDAFVTVVGLATAEQR